MSISIQSRVHWRRTSAGVLALLLSVSEGRAATVAPVYDANGNLGSTGSAPAAVPSIVRHPLSQMAAPGQPVSFSVIATGAPAPTYQWRRGTTNLPGQTSSTLYLSNPQAADFGDYSVVVTNAAGSATSNTATLTADNNGDGLPDVAGDTDGDLLPDAWEQTNLGNLNSGAYNDNDNDGVRNIDELADGTHPAQANSRFFRLTLNPGVTAAPAQDRYAPNTQVTLSAADQGGLLFTEWSGAVTGFQNPGTLIMDGDKAVTALRGTHVLDRTWQAHVTANSGGAYRLLALASGNLMVAGQFSSCQGVPAQNLTRLNADLTVDTSFSMSPGIQDNTEVWAVLELPNGNLLVGGTFATVNGVPRRAIARLFPDGRLDPAFNAANAINSHVYAIGRLSDGRIAIGGAFTNIAGTSRNRVAILSAEGVLDNTFDPGTGFNNFVNGLSVDAGNKLICSGGYTSFATTPAGRIVRLTPAGALDTTFNTGGVGADGNVELHRQLADGRIVICGGFAKFNDVTCARMAVLKADGTHDSAFNPGTNLNGAVYQFYRQADGKFIIGGNFDRYGSTVRSGIARLNTDGTLDASFNPGTGANNWISALLPLSGGRLLAGGIFSQFDGQPRDRLVVVNTVTGALDTAAFTHAAFRAKVDTIVMQRDGKILAGGDFFAGNGRPRTRIARFLPDGSVDPAFVPDAVNSTVSAVVPQRDGRILVGGSFTLTGTAQTGKVIRLLSSGTLDPAWQPNGQISGSVFCLLEDSQGRILAGGDFHAYGTTHEQPSLLRLLPDGKLDTSFTGVLSRSNDFYGGYADEIREQPDGKILVCGGFDLASGYPITNMARFHSDGTPDRTFGVNGGTNARVRTMTLLPDGKIMIAGEFTQVAGLVRGYIARLLPDGTPDFSFGTPSSGPNNVIYAMRQWPGGRLLICGDFTQVGGIPRQRIALLESDGTLVTDFNPGTGPDDNIYTLATDSAGRVYAGGWVREMAATPRAGLLRLTNAPGFDVQMTSLTSTGTALNFSATAASSLGPITGVRFEASFDGVEFTHASEGVFQSGGWSGTWTPPAAGTWYVRAVATDPAARSMNSMATAITTGGGGWSAWLAQHFTAGELANTSISGASADPDGDGQPNLAEYTAGTNPRNGGSLAPPLPSIVSAGGNYPGITFRVAGAVTDVTWTVEVSAELNTWNSGPTATTLESNTANPDGSRTITVRANQAVSTGARRMLRVRFSLIP